MVFNAVSVWMVSNGGKNLGTVSTFVFAPMVSQALARIAGLVLRLSAARAVLLMPILVTCRQRINKFARITAPAAAVMCLNSISLLVSNAILLL